MHPGTLSTLKIRLDVTGFAEPRQTKNGMARVVFSTLTEVDKRIDWPESVFFASRDRGFVITRKKSALVDRWLRHHLFLLAYELTRRAAYRFFWSWLKRNSRARFSSREFIFSLGRFWMHNRYHIWIRRMKEEKGIRYMPLIYDMLPWRYPQGNARDFRERYLFNILEAIKLADVIVTVSQNSALDIQAFAKEKGVICPPVEVVYLGDGFSFTSLCGAEKSEIEEILAGKKFVLAVTPGRVNKNKLLLAEVWRVLAEKYGKEKIPRLVIVDNGETKSFYLDSRRKLNAEQKENVAFLHGVSDNVLAELYQKCFFTVYPSAFEGWGLPVRESFCFGKCCVIFPVTSLPEAGGVFATYAENNDLPSLCAAIEKLIFDDGYRNKKEDEIRNNFRPRGWKEFLDDVSAIAAKY